MKKQKQPEQSWSFKDVKIGATSKYELREHQRHLIVKNVEEKDDGMYECTGKHFIGRTTSQVQLKVVCKLFLNIKYGDGSSIFCKDILARMKLNN